MIFKRFVFIFILMWSAKSNEDGYFFIAKQYGNNNVFCITNSSFALSWTDEEITETLHRASISTYKPVFSENDSILFDEKSWLFTNSLQSGISEVILDERWEEINTEITEECKYYSKNLKFSPVLTISKSEFEIPMSIRTEQEAHIFLCDGEDPSNSECYWFMLQAWNGNRTAIRKCNKEHVPSDKGVYPQKTCKTERHNITHPHNPKYLFKDRWTHFKLIKKSDTLAFYKFNNNDLTEIIKWTDTEYEKVDVKHMIIHSKFFKGLWKIHNISFIHTNKEFKHIEQGLPIQPDQGLVCISMYVAMCTFCKIKLTLSDGSDILDERTFSAESSGWFKIRFINRNVKSRNEIRLLVSTIGSDAKRYWAIDKVRVCHENEIRYIGVTEEKKCQLVAKDDVISLKMPLSISDNSCPENTIGKFCIPCDWFYKNCKKIKVCEEERCMCSAGYTTDDSDCYYQCSQNSYKGYYGHGCRNKCGHCKWGDYNCDSTDGTCSRGCEDGYTGSTCEKRPSLVFVEAPEIVNISYTSAVILVTNFTIEKGVNEEPSFYIVQFKKAENHDSKWNDSDSSQIFNKSSPIKIFDLEADTKYFVRAVISSFSKTYDTEYVRYKEFTTKCEDVTEEQINIKSSNTTADVFIRASKYTCKLIKYQIIIKGIGKAASSNETFLFFEGLKPFTHYTLDVQIGSGLLEKGFQTTEGVPAKIDNVIISHLSDTSIEITWTKPKLRGIFKHYIIKYQHLSFLACGNTNSISSPKSLIVKNASARVGNLMPYSRYSFSVYTANTKLKGPPLTISESTYASNKIKADEVPKIESIVSGHNAVAIKLSELNCDKMHGPLSVKATWMCHSPWCSTSNETHKTFIYIPSSSSIKLENLIPFSDYSLQLKYCRNNTSCSKEVLDTRQFKTNVTVPNYVRDLLVYSKNTNSVSLRWRPPYPPTGHLKDYTVSFREEVDYWYKTWDGESNLCKLWPDFYCAKINGLTSRSTYHFQVLAKNQELTEFGYPANVSAYTAIDKSDAPYDLKLVWTLQNDLELEWKHPNVTNGDIEYFEILCSPEEKSMISKKLMIVNNEYHLTYQYKIDSKEIIPATTYRIRISAYNGMKGEQVIGRDSSPPEIPHLDQNLEAESTNTTISVKMSSKKTGIVVVVLISDKNCNFKNDMLEMKGFRKVSNCNITESLVGRFTITIGDDRQLTACSQLANPPLESGTIYNITVLLTNTFKNKTRSNIYSLKYKTQGDRTYSETNSNLFGLLALLFIVPLVAILYIKRDKISSYKNNILQQDNPSTEVLEIDEDQIPLSNVRQEHIIMPTQKRNQKIRNRTSNPNPKSKTYSKCIKITDFELYVRESIQNGELDRQHALFPRGQTQPWTYGSLKENKSKNRYNNLIAYDHSRVVLETVNGDPHSDYINANYIDGHKVSQAYIATQGPKAATLNDFWRMIWQENVKYIANLANIYEGGKKKVEKYWPDINETLQFGNISVQHLQTQVFADYEHRQFSVSQNKESRKIEQLHFSSWPDHGVPLYSQSLVPFLQKVLQFPLSPNSPIVVHCSAGVGRTGTILLCDISLRMAAREGFIDVLKNLQNLREQRANMVDNIEQYKLAHLVILECLVGMHTGIPCNEMEESIRKLLATGGITSQMRYLKDTQWQDQAMKTVGQRNHEAVIVHEKNRFKNIIPEIQGRIFISRYPADDETSSYINAVKVDGFRCPGRFIVTQQPMPNTLGDFWRLIDENNISIIISLNEINLNDKTSCHFWPISAQPETHPVPDITLKHVNTLSFECYNITTVHMHVTSRKEHFPVEIIAVKNWPPNTNCPKSTEEFLTFWEKSDAMSRQSNPVLITCYDGVKASGLYVALSFVIEKMKLEQICDVCQAVRTIRHNREQFVQDVQQFEFLYKAALLYINGFESYSNFN